MGYRLKLRPSAVLALPRAEVDALVREGDGAAALLYLYLASAAAPLEDAELCRALHWDRAALDAARQTLEHLGLLGEAEAATETPEAPARCAPDYSRADIAAVLEHDGGFAALRDAVGKKLNRIMTEKDDEMLLGLYNYLGLDADVIFTLVGHCVERTERRYGPHRRPTMRQVEKEGYRWKRLGIVTQALAEEYLKEYARRQQLVPRMMEVLHLGSRAPVSQEAKFLDRWIGWGFSPEAVEYAYEKTVFKCGKLEWNYLNGILRDLDKKGLHDAAEIRRRDQLGASSPRCRKESDDAAAAAADVQNSVAWMKEYLGRTEQEGGNDRGL